MSRPQSLYDRSHMPAALDVDWEAVRTLAVAVGVREAARRVGLDESTVQSRSQRERWLADLPRSQPLPPTVLARATSETMRPSEAMAGALRDMSARTRLGHARVAQAVAEHVETMEGQEALLSMPLILQGAKHAAVVHSWAGSSGQTPMRLDILAGSGSAVRLTLGGESTVESEDVEP